MSKCKCGAYEAQCGQGGNGTSEWHMEDGCGRSDARTLRQRFCWAVGMFVIGLGGPLRRKPIVTRIA